MDVGKQEHFANSDMHFLGIPDEHENSNQNNWKYLNTCYMYGTSEVRLQFYRIFIHDYVKCFIQINYTN